MIIKTLYLSHALTDDEAVQIATCFHGRVIKNEAKPPLLILALINEAAWKIAFRAIADKTIVLKVLC